MQHDSASGTLPRMKSTCAFTTAMFRWVPPCSTNLLPTARRFWSCPAYTHTLTGSTAARAAMISSAAQPLRCWLTMSDWRNTPHPMARRRHGLGRKARSA